MKALFSLCSVTIIIILISVLNYGYAYRSETAEEVVSKANKTLWIEWLSVTFYRGFYIVFMAAILFCTVLNVIKNKTDGKADKKWENYDCAESSSFSLLNRNKNVKEEGQGGGFPESDDQLRERLKLAQDEIEGLRAQLTASLDTKAELESTLAILDKETISAEMHLEMERVQGAVELERLRKDNIAIRREIQKLIEEKDEVEKEAERLDRDVRISRSASVDADFLEERLGAVRKEAKFLKEQFSILIEEKHKTSSVLSEVPDLSIGTFPSESDSDLAIR